MPAGDGGDRRPLAGSRSRDRALAGDGVEGLPAGDDVEGERLTDKSVALVVKRAAKLAGINPKNLAGHSLRAGLATAAAIAGVDERSIQEQTGHRSLKVLRTYIRDGSLWRSNAAKKVGL